MHLHYAVAGYHYFLFEVIKTSKGGYNAPVLVERCMLTDTSSQRPTLSTPCTVAKLSGNIKQQEKETRRAKNRKIKKVSRLHRSTYKKF